MRDEVPTNFQSLVTEEPNSSIHAEYRASEFTGAELPSVENRRALRDEVPTMLRSLVVVEPDSSLPTEFRVDRFTGDDSPKCDFERKGR